MALNPVQVATHAARAGWRGPDLVTAVAVALAETGGNETRPGGLWNVPGQPGGDPAGNAAAAYARWKADGWGAWRTYTSRRYLIFMPAAAAAAVAADVRAIVTDPVEAGASVVGELREAAGNLPGESLLDAARNALAVLYKAGAWVANPDNWLRVAYVGVGASLLVGALVIVARPAIEPVIDKAAAIGSRGIVGGKR